MADVPSEMYRRFLKEWDHLASPFGGDSFGKRAEGFARFFGTPKFLVGQTVIVAAWIAYNAVTGVNGHGAFDVYPFILLNLMFSLQAAYAAPLILLAQTRQADRDKAQADSDARHREEIAQQTLHGQRLAAEGIDLLKRLLDENTKLTQQVDELTRQIHGKVVAA